MWKAFECKLNHQLYSRVSADFVGFVFDCTGISGYNRNIEFSHCWFQGLSFQSSIMSLKLSLCVSRVLSDNWESIGLLTLSRRRQRRGRGADNQPKHPWISLCPTSLVLYFQGLKSIGLLLMKFDAWERSGVCKVDLDRGISPHPPLFTFVPFCF